MATTARVELTRTSSVSRFYGLGTIYAKTMRDSRLAFIIAAGLLGGLSLVMGAAISTVFPTPEARQEVDKLIGGIPSSMVNFFGKPVGLGTLGGYLTWKYGLTSSIATLALVDPRAVLDARRRGEPGQPRPRRDHAIRQAPHRDREGRGARDDARPRPRLHGADAHGQLEHVRRRGAGRSGQPAAGDRVRPVARLHRALLRRPRVRARAAARPGRRCRRLPASHSPSRGRSTGSTSGRWPS